MTPHRSGDQPDDATAGREDEGVPNVNRFFNLLEQKTNF